MDTIEITKTSNLLGKKRYIFVEEKGRSYAGNFEITDSNIEISSIYLKVSDENFKQKLKKDMLNLIRNNIEKIKILENTNIITI